MKKKIKIHHQHKNSGIDPFLPVLPIFYCKFDTHPKAISGEISSKTNTWSISNTPC